MNVPLVELYLFQGVFSACVCLGLVGCKRCIRYRTINQVCARKCLTNEKLFVPLTSSASGSYSVRCWILRILGLL